MQDYDEKRSYIRMNVDCDITYKLANTYESKTGRCLSISGAGLSFIAECPFQPGVAMEVTVLPKNTLTPPMTAYIEVVRYEDLGNNCYQIAATIQSIKGS